jgi:hypothetical protein
MSIADFDRHPCTGKPGSFAGVSGYRYRLRMLFLCLVLIGIFASWPVPSFGAEDRAVPLRSPAGAKGVIYEQNFKNGIFHPRWFGLDSAGGTTAQVLPDPRGLRVTIEKGLAPTVRLGTRFRLRGDFEITASYEIISPMKAPPGAYFGPEIHIKPDGDWAKFASIANYVRADGSTYVVAHGHKEDGKDRFESRTMSTKARSGRFRLVRAGDNLKYFVADGEDGKFRQLFQTEFGSQDIEMVRLEVIRDKTTEGCDIIWKDLAIRADMFPGTDIPLDSSWSTALWLGIPTVLVVIAATVWAARSRGKKS